MHESLFTLKLILLQEVSHNVLSRDPIYDMVAFWQHVVHQLAQLQIGHGSCVDAVGALRWAWSDCYSLDSDHQLIAWPSPIAGRAHLEVSWWGWRSSVFSIWLIRNLIACSILYLLPCTCCMRLLIYCPREHFKFAVFRQVKFLFWISDRRST